MSDVALIAEDTRDAVTFIGATSTSVVLDGQVTDHPLPDRTSISDGVTQLPATASIEAILTPRQLGSDGQALGEEGIARILAQLDGWKRSGTSLSLQRPRMPLVTLMAIERISDRQDSTDGLRVSVLLKQVRIAKTTTVELERIKGPPRDEVKAGLSEEADGGTGTTEETPTAPDTRSTAAVALDTGTDFVSSIFRR